jgi:hypothetical protein
MYYTCDQQAAGGLWAFGVGRGEVISGPGDRVRGLIDVFCHQGTGLFFRGAAMEGSRQVYFNLSPTQPAAYFPGDSQPVYVCMSV